LLIKVWQDERDNVIGRSKRSAAQKSKGEDDLWVHVDQLLTISRVKRKTRVEVGTLSFELTIWIKNVVDLEVQGQKRATNVVQKSERETVIWESATGKKGTLFWGNVRSI
jgi:hypothetical protein